MSKPKSTKLDSGAAISLGLQYGLLNTGPLKAKEKAAILMDIYNVRVNGRRLFRRSDFKKLLEEI